MTNEEEFKTLIFGVIMFLAGIVLKIVNDCL